MSQYLVFVLKRAGVLQLDRVLILQHSTEWVNQQIYDEFTHLAPEAVIQVVDTITSLRAKEGDLVVLPYLMTFSDQGRHHLPDYRRLAAVDGLWVMLYGVMRRAIHVIPAKQLPAFYLSDRWTLKLAWFLRHTRLVAITRRLGRGIARR